ncbi:MAG TPA: HTH domain-containing protein [Pseudomonadota bacterium]|nr:HTH domain-containing protein [Pseudomonadota bacterium]HNO68801.1 HTH domain-containing protein [Pseudomonadota bacterium]
MTFVEAAVQILRREGKPLHVKELTRLAIKHNLLSVVGRDPEAMMETRLLIEAKRPSADLVRVSPGVFGLRVYPPRGERGEALKAEGEKVTKPKAESAATPAKDPRAGKRRRTGRGAESAEAPAEAAKKPAETAEAVATPAAVEAVSVPVTSAAVDPPASEAKPAPAKGRGRTRSRATETRKAPPATEAPSAKSSPAVAPDIAVAPVAPVVPTVPSQNTPIPAVAAVPSRQTPVPAAAPAVPVPNLTPAVPIIPTTDIAKAAEPSAKTPSPAPTAAPAPVVAVVTEPPASDLAKRPFQSTKSPVPLAPSVPATAESVAATAPVVRPAPSAVTPPRPVEAAAPPRPVEAATPPRNEASGHRPAPPPHAGDRPAAPRDERPAPSANTPAPAQPGPSQPQQPRVMSMADAAYDVLRGASDGRALTNRQIAEIAVKRRLVRGELADVSRSVRVALVREQRHRDSEGLRPRIRTVGPGQYTLGERKLEPELYNAERELLDRAGRTREATRVALRRRIRQLPSGAFELLMRLLLERMGMVGAEIVKRGDGVAYYGGTLSRGARSIKVLVAVRPGEGELSKEAVGELRAGVRLRGFDEGMILCSARAGAAAHAEASATPGVELYDQDALTELLVRQHLGVRRMHLPVDYLDTELFNELLEQG